MCFPFHRPKLVLLDILLPAPRTAMGRAKARVIGFFLRRMHLIMLYYRDTSGLQKHFRVPANRFVYVPFKVNQPHLIKRATPSDGSYVFCGGKTRRDFAVLFEAVRGTDWAIKVVTTDDSDIARHGSYLDDRDAPINVEIVRLDGSPEEFIDHMAASSLVVLPIAPDICGAGISVYIQAMALRKCVVISTGPGTSDVLTSGQAILVPPSNPVALRQAIDRALSDPGYRNGFERRGYDWASSLGGEKQLYTNLLSRLYEDYLIRGRTRRHGSRSAK
jgi:glycosyltransferase involved in cell wall biosynthesis